MIALNVLFWALAVIAVLVALTMIAVLVVAVVVFVTPRGKVSKVQESERVDIKMDRDPVVHP